MNRIGIVCGAGYVSGKEIMALELGEGLHEKGDRVEFVTSSWGDGEFRRRLHAMDLRAHVMRLGFISATLTLDAMRMTGHQLLYLPALLRRYRRFLRRFGPHRVVHTNWHHLLLLYPFLNSQRDIYWVHEVLPDKPQYRTVFKWLENRLHRFVAVSHAVANSLRRIGIASRKIKVIHNGIKDPCPGKTGSPSPTSHVRIGIIGQVGKWKGHEDLVDAFSVIQEKFPEIQLHIFGDGLESYRMELQARIRALGMVERVFWRGFITDRETIFGGLSICVVPSRAEDPLPTTALEAGFFRIPVVATRRGGLPEIIEDGITGFLVDAASPNQIASRLEQLIGDRVLLSRLGEQGRSSMLAKFERERFIEEFGSLLKGES